MARPGIGGRALSITLPDEQMQKLEQLASERRGPKAQVVREALDQYFSSLGDHRVRQGNHDATNDVAPRPERAGYEARSSA